MFWFLFLRILTLKRHKMKNWFKVQSSCSKWLARLFLISVCPLLFTVYFSHLLFFSLKTTFYDTLNLFRFGFCLFNMLNDWNLILKTLSRLKVFFFFKVNNKRKLRVDSRSLKIPTVSSYLHCTKSKFCSQFVNKFIKKLSNVKACIFLQHTQTADLKTSA